MSCEVNALNGEIYWSEINLRINLRLNCYGEQGHSIKGCTEAVGGCMSNVFIVCMIAIQHKLFLNVGGSQIFQLWKNYIWLSGLFHYFSCSIILKQINSRPANTNCWQTTQTWIKQPNGTPIKLTISEQLSGRRFRQNPIIALFPISDSR